jgi:hypothetical protein
MKEYLFCCTFFYSAAVVHDENPVCHRPGQIKVMGNEQAGYVMTLADAAYQACDVIADSGIKGTGHFITDEKFRAYDKAAEQGRSLTFPSADFMGIAPDKISCQMDFFHMMPEHFRGTWNVIIVNPCQNAFFQCKPGMKRPVRMLEDHLYVMVQILPFFFRNMGDILIVKKDMAAVCPGKLTNEAAKRTFATATFSGHSQNFAR